MPWALDSWELQRGEKCMSLVLHQQYERFVEIEGESLPLEVLSTIEALSTIQGSMQS